MIGNDIVDIAEARQKSDWQRPRFLEKLFTTKEQQIINKSDNPFLMVWRLWSMKESAYKLYTQLHPSRFYNPKQFACEIDDSQGKVRYKDFVCYVKTNTTSQYIISEACLVKANMVSECIEIESRLSKNQSDTIKAKLLLTIAQQFNILKEDLTILKSDFGIPSVYHNSKKLNIGISISHHGNFGAYAIV
jgi:phosphopantetheinyl transferase (holo-ACP synthase)